MLRHFRFFAVTALFMAALLSATTALAAPAAWQRVDVILHLEDAGGVLLVSGALPTDAKLPVEGELAVPNGSSLLWIGQILGGETAADPALEYVKSSAGTSDLYRFTLTQSPKAQIEIKTAGAKALGGGTFGTGVKWTAPAAVPEVTLSVRIPSDAKIVTADASATTVPGEPGFIYYTKTVNKVKAGDELALDFTYSAAAAGNAGGTPATSGSSTTTILVTLALVALLGTIMIVAIWARMRTRTATEIDEADEETEEDPEPLVSDSIDGEADEAEAAPQPNNPMKTLVTVIVVGVLLVFVIAVAVFSTKPQISGDTISRTFATGEACATDTFSLAIPSGADPVATAESLFAALKTVPGMNNATYNIKTANIVVGYCSTEASKEQVRAAMQPTGFVTP